MALNRYCAECGRRGAITAATFVDHKRPHGGNDAMFWDQSNWQPLCRHHSNVKTGQETRAREQSRSRAAAMPEQEKPSFTIPVTVVCGPPGAGKTTYVNDHAEPGDLIIDFDPLYVVLSNQPMYTKPQDILPFVVEARAAVIERLRTRSNVRHAWLITMSLRKQERQTYEADGADVVTLATPADECLRRIAAAPGRENWPDWETLVNDWWASYEE